MKKCGQCSKPAVLHITELRDGEATALHLCEVCAKDYLKHAPVKSGGDAEAAEGEPEAAEDDGPACPRCGMTFKEFRALGRLGCPFDYEFFHEQLTQLLENIHSETQHAGKRVKRSPEANQRQRELLRLRADLRIAVDEERYEDAARLRDEIHTLEHASVSPPPQD